MMGQSRVLCIFITHLFVFFVLLPLSIPADAALTVREAIEAALHKNPSLNQVREKINQTQTEVPLARGALLPTVTFSTSESRKKDVASSPSAQFGGSSYSYYSSDFHLQQPIWVFGAISGLRSAKKDVQLQRLSTDISARGLINTVLQQFYLVVHSNRTVDTLARQEKIVHESLDTAQRRERTGRGQLLDVLQVKTQIALLAGQITTAKDKVQSDAVTLANLLGDPEIKTFDLKDGLEAPMVEDVDHKIDLAHPHIPEIDQANLQLDQIEDQKWVKLGPHLPSLVATGDYMWNTTEKADMFAGDSNAWALGIQLNIPIFSGLSSIYEQQSIASQRVQLEYNRENVKNQIALGQVTNRKSLEAAQSSILTGKEALKLATASSNEAKRQYRLATIDFLQFLKVQQDYVQAEQTLNDNKLAYIQALGNYYVASGQNLYDLIDLLDKANL